MKKHEKRFFEQFIGLQVTKPKKPFKSGFKINTIKGVIKHKELKCFAFIFEEDDSYVSVYQCRILRHQ